MSQSSVKKGKLIVFEGGEGAGKTELGKGLEQWMYDFDIPQKYGFAGVVLTRQPGGTIPCLDIRQVIMNHRLCSTAELMLYAADRAEHVENYIIPALDAGNIVLCDRYKYSTIAYQGYGRGLSLSKIETLNKMASHNISGDLVLWLDLDPRIGLDRISYRLEINRLDKEDIDFHKRVRKGYQILHKNNPIFKRIDAEKSSDLVFLEAQKAIESLLKSD